MTTIKEPLESEVERELFKQVREQGGQAYKFTSPGNAGVPDRLLILPGGLIIFVELKRSTRFKLEPLQTKVISDMQRLGAQVRVVRGLEEVRELIAGLHWLLKDPHTRNAMETVTWSTKFFLGDQLKELKEASRYEPSV